MEFFIECGDRYRFGYREVIFIRNNDDHGSDQIKNLGVEWIGEVDNSTMTRPPPVGASFTGMTLGLYAFGELQKCLTPADFEYAGFVDGDGD